MGSIKIDLSNVISISLIGFAGVWIINRLLARAGQSNLQA